MTYRTIPGITIDLHRVSEISYNSILSNLRYRWKELSKYSDDQIIALYLEFAMSEDFGDNDKKFPFWFEFLSQE